MMLQKLKNFCDIIFAYLEDETYYKTDGNTMEMLPYTLALCRDVT